MSCKKLVGLSLGLIVILHLTGLIYASINHRGVNYDAAGILVRISNNKSTQSDAPHIRYLNRVIQIPTLIAIKNNDWKLSTKAATVFALSQHLFPFILCLISCILIFKKDYSNAFIPIILYLSIIYPGKQYLFNIADEVASLFIFQLTLIFYYHDLRLSKIMLIISSIAMLFSYELAFLAFGSTALYIFSQKSMRRNRFFQLFPFFQLILMFIQCYLIFSMNKLDENNLSPGLNALENIPYISRQIYGSVLCILSILIIRFNISMFKVFGVGLIAYAFELIYKYQLPTGLVKLAYDYRVFVVPFTIFFGFGLIHLRTKRDEKVFAATVLTTCLLLAISYLNSDIKSANYIADFKQKIKIEMSDKYDKCVVANREIMDYVDNFYFNPIFLTDLSIIVMSDNYKGSILVASSKYCNTYSRYKWKRNNINAPERQLLDQSSLPTYQHR